MLLVSNFGLDHKTSLLLSDYSEFCFVFFSFIMLFDLFSSLLFNCICLSLSFSSITFFKIRRVTNKAS